MFTLEKVIKTQRRSSRTVLLFL